MTWSVNKMSQICESYPSQFPVFYLQIRESHQMFTFKKLNTLRLISYQNCCQCSINQLINHFANCSCTITFCATFLSSECSSDTKVRNILRCFFLNWLQGCDVIPSVTNRGCSKNTPRLSGAADAHRPFNVCDHLLLLRRKHKIHFLVLCLSISLFVSVLQCNLLPSFTRGSDITDTRPWLTDTERYSCPIMHYSHSFL